MATFSTVVFSFCQRECGFALGTILGMFVILPVRTIFRRFYSGYVAHYDDMWVCVRVHVWCGCVVLVAVAGLNWLLLASVQKRVTLGMKTQKKMCGLISLYTP